MGVEDDKTINIMNCVLVSPGKPAEGGLTTDVTGIGDLFFKYYL
jgi:hypothetical protein